MSNLEYYVYAYISERTGLPYYIGKGKNKRAYRKHGRIKIPVNKKFIVFLETKMTNIGACALERRYIKWYGRKDLDENGILLNYTEGGEGNDTAKFINYVDKVKNTDYKKIAKKVSETLNNLEWKNKNYKTCPHCGICCEPRNYKRWHGDNCKMKPKY